MFIISFFLFNSKEVCWVHDSTVQNMYIITREELLLKRDVNFYYLMNVDYVPTHTGSFAQNPFQIVNQFMKHFKKLLFD